MTDYWLLSNLFREKSTGGCWLISQTNVTINKRKDSSWFVAKLCLSVCAITRRNVRVVASGGAGGF
jgi:hypothetical protein